MEKNDVLKIRKKRYSCCCCQTNKHEVDVNNNYNVNTVKQQVK